MRNTAAVTGTDTTPTEPCSLCAEGCRCAEAPQTFEWGATLSNGFNEKHEWTFNSYQCPIVKPGETLTSHPALRQAHELVAKLDWPRPMDYNDCGYHSLVLNIWNSGDFARPFGFLNRLQHWPEELDADSPTRWGLLAFGKCPTERSIRKPLTEYRFTMFCLPVWARQPAPDAEPWGCQPWRAQEQLVHLRTGRARSPYLPRLEVYTLHPLPPDRPGIEPCPCGAHLSV